MNLTMVVLSLPLTFVLSLKYAIPFIQQFFQVLLLNYLKNKTRNDNHCVNTTDFDSLLYQTGLISIDDFSKKRKTQTVNTNN